MYKFLASYSILNFVITLAGAPALGELCLNPSPPHGTCSQAASAIRPSINGGSPVTLVVAYDRTGMVSFCASTSAAKQQPVKRAKAISFMQAVMPY